MQCTLNLYFVINTYGQFHCTVWRCRDRYDTACRLREEHYRIEDEGHQTKKQQSVGFQLRQDDGQGRDPVKILRDELLSVSHFK